MAPESAGKAACLRALQYKYSYPGKRLAVIATTTTNDHGEYRLHGLTPGSYYIVASTTRDRVLKENGVSIVGHYPVTFYPSVTALESAVATSVKAADEAVVNFTLTATKSYTIRGRVAGNDPNARIVLMMLPELSTGESLRGQAVDEHGVFEIKGVIPGDYRLMAMGKAQGVLASGKKKIAVEDRDLNDLLVTLQNARTAIGGCILARALVDRSKLKVKLLPSACVEADDDESTMLLAPRVEKGSPIPDRSGRFTAAELTRDAHTVFATVEPTAPGFEDWWVESVSFDGQDVTNTGFDPSVRGDLRIEYRPDSAIVEGTVVAEDGKAIPGATVAILPDHEHRQRRDLYHFVRADQHGDYSVHGLAPGNYKVLAWDGDVDMDAIYDSDFIKPYLVMSKTQTVKVSPKSKYNIALSGISDATDLGAQ